MILIAAGLLALATACSLTLTGTPTPKPTHTPVPLIPAGTTSALPTPTISPERFMRAGKSQRFRGETAAALGRGEEAFAQAQYQAALEGFLETQHLHGEPSAVLQSWIGHSYKALGQHNQAIQHYTNAIELEDRAVNRTNRGILYKETGQCSLAIEDAKAALTMEPATGEGSHTDIEANIILVGCYIQQGNNLSALQHADAAYALATKHNVRAERAEGIRKQREAIQLILEGKLWPEDLFLKPALTHITLGTELHESGRYAEAIISFEIAQEVHGKPSGAIQVWIGHAYSTLGQHETAIKHFTAAVKIRDTPYHRVIRSIEYTSNHRCAEAISDAEAALAMNPYSEPGYHTSTEAHSILAACLMESGDEPAALAHLEQAISIAQTHGYTQEDIAAISTILDYRENSLAKAIIITPMPPVPAANPKPRVEKTDLTALTDLQGAKWLQQNYPDTARKMAKMPWIADGADPGEEKIVDLLILILSRGLQTNVFDPTGKSLREEDALLMLDMPFLQSIEPGDLPAVRALSSIVQDDGAQFSAILQHPNFQGTITDEWTPIIATLWGAYRNDPSLIPVLLTPGMISLESRKIELPHTGTVELHIVRVGDEGNSRVMDMLEEAVANVEFFMALPLPVQMVSVLFADSVTPSYSGNNFGASITVLPQYEREDEILPGILAHEAAHYYWSGNQDWIDEGMSDLIQSYHRWQTTGIPMTASIYPCPHFSNIQQLERANPGKNEDAFRCNYSLGERIFLNLWQELGNVPFREGSQRLYEKTKTGGASIEDVRVAWNRLKIVEKWYSSADTGTVQGIDGSKPTWKLDEIHGRIENAGIVLSQGGALVESFSTGRHQGYAYLQFDYTHPTFIEDSWTVDLMMTEAFEDGFTYNVRPLELTVKGIHVRGTWRISVGPGEGEKWKPGKHIVMLHDRNGTKVAEVRWNVTP